jgi:Uma2 family endonuclease
MNEHLRPPALPPTTSAAEGLPRRRFSVAEIEAMVEAGVIPAKERFELIGGEIVPMSAKGIRHEVVKGELNRVWIQRIPDDVGMVPETTFRLSDDTYVEPDFVFYRRSVGLAGLKPATCLLAVEVADSSLLWDSGRKADLYASFGIAELWVIDVRDMATIVCRDPGPTGYRHVLRLPASETLRVSFAPVLDLSLAALDLT